MKIIFVDEQDSSEHESEAEAVSQLFGLADQLSETDLAKLKKVVDNFRPEAMKPGP